MVQREDDGLLVARRAVPWPGDPSKLDVGAFKSMTVRPNLQVLSVLTCDRFCAIQRH